MIATTELAKMWCADQLAARHAIAKAFAERHLTPRDFRLREMAENLIFVGGSPIGPSELRLLESRGESVHVLESSGVISTSAFRFVTERIVNAAVLEGAQAPEPAVSNLLPVLDGRTRRTEILQPTLPLEEGKQAADIQEGQEYPVLGIYGERLRTLPARKKGFQIPLTREAVLADDSGQLIQTARDAGRALAAMKESLVLDFIAGNIPNCVFETRAGSTTETVSNLFLTSGAWINSQVNALVDYTNVETALKLLAGNTLTATSYLAEVKQPVLVVPYHLRMQAWRILNGIETRSGTTNVVIAPPPFSTQGGLQQVTLVSSLQLVQRQKAAGKTDVQAQGTWFLGDLAQAFRYYQLWPITVEEDPTPAGRYTHDVWARFQASECGVPVAIQPRVWCQNLPA